MRVMQYAFLGMVAACQTETGGSTSPLAATGLTETTGAIPPAIPWTPNGGSLWSPATRHAALVMARHADSSVTAFGVDPGSDTVQFVRTVPGFWVASMTKQSDREVAVLAAMTGRHLCSISIYTSTTIAPATMARAQAVSARSPATIAPPAHDPSPVDKCFVAPPTPHPVPVNNVIPQDQVAQAIIAASPYLAAGLDDGCRALLDELTGDGADPAARVREASAEDMPLWPDDIALPGLISAAVGGRNLVTGVDVLSNKLAFAREVSAADLENLTAQSDREIAAIAAETGRALCAAHQRIDISEVSPSTSTTPTAASTRVAPLTIPGGPGDSAPSLRLMVDALGMAYSIGVSNMGPALPAECTTEVIRLSCESDRKR